MERTNSLAPGSINARLWSKKFCTTCERMCYPRDQSVPREEEPERGGTHASVSCGKSVSAVARRNQCAILEFIGPSGIPVILRMESRGAAVHDLLILDGDCPRPLENPCPLAHSVARSPATGIGNIDIKEEGFDWMSGKGERRGEEEDIPGLSRCFFIPSIPHGERQVNP